jgi:hypothetical protein
MKRILNAKTLVLLGAVVAAGAFGATALFAHTLSTNSKVGPQTFTKVNIINDCPSNGSCDMKGPKIGLLKYSQGNDGSLSLSLTFSGVDANTAYPVYLACGPSHDLACGFSQVGTITTNASGAGSGTVNVPVATLQASPYGCGYRTDHVDLVAGNNYPVAGATNYYVPCGSGAHPTKPTGKGDPTG